MQLTQESLLSIVGKKLKPPVFLTGCGRSGTSMLQRIIANHKNIYSFISESHFFGKYNYIPPLHEVNIDAYLDNANYAGALEILYKEFESKKEFKNLVLSILSVMLYTVEHSPDMIINKGYKKEALETFNEIKELDEYKKLSNRYEAFNLCANYLTLKSNKKRWADKSPINMFNTTKILELFPDAKFIEIYRDPRAVYYSWTRCPFKYFKLTNPIICIKRWRKTAEVGEKLQKELQGTYYRVKYEDLLLDPVAEIKKICDFIEEEFDPNMLQVKTTNSSFKKYNKKAGIDSERTNHWKKSLSRNELILIDLATRKFRKNLGYMNIAPKLTLANFLPFALFSTKLCIKAKVNPIKYIKKIKKENART